MRSGVVVVLALVAGCYLGKSGKDCDPGPFYSGPSLGNPKAASFGDRFLVRWHMTEESNILGSDHGVMLAGDGTVIPDSRFDFDTEREQEVFSLTSGPDRVLVQSAFGHVIDGSIRETFVEIRLPTGERQGPPIAGISGSAVFDGDAFLLGKSSGTALRVGPDGTVSPTFPIPLGLARWAPLATVTWAVLENEQVVTASRIMRGGALLDVAPRPVLVAEELSSFLVASRPTEAAIVTQGREDARTWITLSEDGTISPPVPLVLDLPYFDARFLVAERDGYLLVLENFGDSEVMGVHLSPNGTPGEPFVLIGEHGSSLAFAHSADRTLILYGPVRAEPLAPPRIEAIPIDSGALPGAPLLVETVEGETYTVDCGCNAGGGSGGLLIVLAFVFGLRCRRALGMGLLIGLFVVATAGAAPRSKVKPAIENLTSLIDKARKVTLTEGVRCKSKDPLSVLVMDSLTLTRGPVDFMWRSLESDAIDGFRDLVAKRSLEKKYGGDLGAAKAEKRVLGGLPAALPTYFLVIRVDERTGSLVDGKPSGKARGHAFLVDAKAGTLRCSLPFEKAVTSEMGNTVSWRQVPPDVFEGRTFHMILPSTLETALTGRTRDAIRDAFAAQGLELELLP